MEQQNQEQQLTKKELLELERQEKLAKKDRLDREANLRELIKSQDLEIKYMENIMYLAQLRQQFKQFIDNLNNPPVKMQEENTDTSVNENSEKSDKES